MRLNKYLAHSGLGTRREASEFVKKGRVTVNGQTITNPAHIIEQDDAVTYNGKQLHVKKGKAYILMNKPKNFTVVYDIDNNKSVAKILRPKITNVVTTPLPLNDKDRGLILLTDDSSVTDKLGQPEHKIKQMFELTLDKTITEEDLQKLISGVKVNGQLVAVQGASHVQDKGDNIVGIESHVIDPDFLDELFSELGYQIEVLDRMYIAGLTKKDLPRGFFRKLTEKEIIFLRHFF